MNSTPSTEAVRKLYDIELRAGSPVRERVFPKVFGQDQFVGQYSDNSADRILNLALRASIGPQSHVLDVGCGSAGPACFVAEKTGCRVTCVDVSEVHFAQARERIRQRGLGNQIQLVFGDVFEVARNMEPVVDVVWGLGSFCHLNPRIFFPLAQSLLKLGGRIAFMERVQLHSLGPALSKSLTDEWASPSVESFGSYYEALHAAGFGNVFIADLSAEYRMLQDRFVDVRRELKSEIVSLMGVTAYARDLELVEAERDAAAQEMLGYAQFVAERVS